MIQSRLTGVTRDELEVKTPGAPRSFGTFLWNLHIDGPVITVGPKVCNSKNITKRGFI